MSYQVQMSVGSDLFTLLEDDIVRVYNSGKLSTRTDDLLLSLGVGVTGGSAATYVVTPTNSGKGSGATLSVTLTNATTISTVTVQNAGSGYLVGDTLTIAATELGATSTATTYVLVEGDIAASVSHIGSTGYLKYVDVDEIPSLVAAQTQTLISVTSGGSIEYINSGRIAMIDDSGSGASIRYDVGGAAPSTFTVTQTKAVVNERIQDAAGQQVHAVSAATPATPSFSFTGSAALQAKIVAGVTLTIVGSTGNDGTYTVASSTGTAPTVVTVVEPVPDATADGKIILDLASASYLTY